MSTVKVVTINLIIPEGDPAVAEWYMDHLSDFRDDNPDKLREWELVRTITEIPTTVAAFARETGVQIRKLHETDRVLVEACIHVIWNTQKLHRALSDCMHVYLSRAQHPLTSDPDAAGLVHAGFSRLAMDASVEYQRSEPYYRPGPPGSLWPYIAVGVYCEAIRSLGRLELTETGARVTAKEA